MSHQDMETRNESGTKLNELSKGWKWKSQRPTVSFWPGPTCSWIADKLTSCQQSLMHVIFYTSNYDHGAAFACQIRVFDMIFSSCSLQSVHSLLRLQLNNHIQNQEISVLVRFPGTKFPGEVVTNQAGNADNRTFFGMRPPVCWNCISLRIET